ncbi:MAG: MotA/TolQ/ExbB proton channel family protein [Candidatus Eisenbacteria bacterium]|nr:MotA/TolQ/ExbB proton channel family protein [Candidatus Eisenbacteria bacterium]MCC7142481.1 MotA/TolQ/ExbB proton channel family protein [Candidatus Eisenbacteria bacterium]
MEGFLEHILTAGPVVKAVLLLLLGASVFSWAVIAERTMRLRAARAQDQSFLATFRTREDLRDSWLLAGQLSRSPIAAVYRAAYEQMEAQGGRGASEPVLRAANRGASEQVMELERNVGVLATIASATPFVGLFGTVWGIMTAFADIGAKGSADLAVVAPGISEALITTAAGLAAAIPAVVAYNHFAHKIRIHAVGMENFAQDLLTRIEVGPARPASSGAGSYEASRR